MTFFDDLEWSWRLFYLLQSFSSALPHTVITVRMQVCRQCFDTVGWASGRVSVL